MVQNAVISQFNGTEGSEQSI